MTRFGPRLAYAALFAAGLALAQNSAYRTAAVMTRFSPAEGVPVEVRELSSRCTLRGTVAASDGAAPQVRFARESCGLGYGHFAERPVRLVAELPPSDAGYYTPGTALRLYPMPSPAP